MGLKHLEISTDKLYDTDEYMKFIEDNLMYFVNKEDTDLVEFEPAIGYKYEGDFYGLLQYLNIPQPNHYLIMRLNSYEAAYEFNADRLSVLIYKGNINSTIAKALNAKVR